MLFKPIQKSYIHAVSSPVHQNEMSSYIVETRGTKYNYTLLFWRTSEIFYYYYIICWNTTIITQYAQILLLSLHNATNPLRSTWARAAAQVVGNHMSGYGTLGSGLWHSTCASDEIHASDEIQSPTYI